MSQNREEVVRIIRIKEGKIEERRPPSEEDFEIVYERPIDGPVKLRSEDIEKIKSKISVKRVVVIVIATILSINILFPVFLLDSINARILNNINVNISRTTFKKPSTNRIRLTVNDNLVKVLNDSGIFYINVSYYFFERENLLLLIVRTSYFEIFSSTLVESLKLNQSPTRNLIRLVSDKMTNDYLLFKVVLLIVINLVIIILLFFTIKAWILRRQKYIIIDI